MTVEEPADHRLRHRPAADERKTFSGERHSRKYAERTKAPGSLLHSVRFGVRTVRSATGSSRGIWFIWSKAEGRSAIPVQTRSERPSARVALGLRLERTARARPTVRRDDARGRRARGFVGRGTTMTADITSGAAGGPTGLRPPLDPRAT